MCRCSHIVSCRQREGQRGARGNAQTDDTAAIQGAIDQAAGKRGTVLVPAGTYMVSAVGENRLTLKVT